MFPREFDHFFRLRHFYGWKRETAGSALRVDAHGTRAGRGSGSLRIYCVGMETGVDQHDRRYEGNGAATQRVVGVVRRCVRFGAPEV